MKKINKIFTTVLMVLLVAGSLYADGGKRNGSAGATELLIPVGARGIALGGTTITNVYGVEAMFWNPANVARGQYGTDVMFSYNTHFADMGVSYAAIAISGGGLGTFGASFKTIAIGDIYKTTQEQPDGTGAKFTPTYSVLGLSYSKMLSDRISFGLNINYITEEIDLVKASGLSLDFGISYTNLANIEGLSFAVTMKNIGPQMKFDGSGLYIQATAGTLQRGQTLYKIDALPFELPSLLEIGFGYKATLNAQNTLAFTGTFQNNNYDGDMYRIGAEYAYDNMFFIRGGYQNAPTLTNDYNIYDYAFGAGLKYNVGGMDLKFDYAYRHMKVFDASNIFTVSLGL